MITIRQCTYQGTKIICDQNMLLSNKQLIILMITTTFNCIPVPNNLIQQNRFLPAEQVNIIT